MFGFAHGLRANTQGKGEFAMEFARYAPADMSLTQKLVDDFNNSKPEAQSKKKKAGQR